MAIEIDPTNDRIIYVGSPGGGCWKTKNGGNTWEVLTDDFSSLQVSAIEVDYSNHDIVYLGCSAARLMRSNDGGESWNTANMGINGMVNCIVIHPSIPSTLFAGTSTGLYRSVNQGATWTLITNAPIHDIEFKPNDPTVMYACGKDFFRSTNGGLAFQQINNGIVASDRSFISVTPANPNLVYMVSARGDEFGYLYRSSDAGLSFQVQVTGDAASGTNYFGYSPYGDEPGGQAGYDMAMCVSPTDPNKIWIGGIIVWRSVDGGLSFEAQTEWSLPNSRGYNHADVHVLEYRDEVVYAGTDGGIYKSNDEGDNWIDLSVGLGIRQFYRLGSATTSNHLVTAGAQDNGTSIRRPAGWVDWLGADGMESFFDPSDHSIVYGTSQMGSLYKSTDGGNSRVSLIAPETDGEWVTPFVIDHNAPNVLHVGYRNVFKSTDGGSTWVALTELSGANFEEIALAPSNSNVIYASKGGTLYRSLNGGLNWNTSNVPSGSINYLSVHPSNHLQVAAACTGGRIFTSSDGGINWINYTSMLNGSMNCIVYHNGSDNGLYVGTNNGVFYRNAGMTNWVAYDNGLPNVEVRELEIHYPSGKIRAATYGRGLWQADLYEALPVSYQYLDAQSIPEKGVLVSWATLFENGSDKFEIQRSHNGRDFVSIGVHKAAGNSNTKQHYEFLDASPLQGISYYRLLQADESGVGRFTNFVMVEWNTGSLELTVFPNPSSEEFQVLGSFASEGTAALTVYNSLGETVYSLPVFQLNQWYTLGQKLSPGQYILHIRTTSQQKSIRVVKQ
jgi:photosystem II stability/assembly factor-like uncharacterized protein